jgi:hypothetical protein
MILGVEFFFDILGRGLYGLATDQDSQDRIGNLKGNTGREWCSARDREGAAMDGE